MEKHKLHVVSHAHWPDRLSLDEILRLEKKNAQIAYGFEQQKNADTLAKFITRIEPWVRQSYNFANDFTKTNPFTGQSLHLSYDSFDAIHTIGNAMRGIVDMLTRNYGRRELLLPYLNHKDPIIAGLVSSAYAQVSGDFDPVMAHDFGGAGISLATKLDPLSEKHHYLSQDQFWFARIGGDALQNIIIESGRPFYYSIIEGNALSFSEHHSESGSSFGSINRESARHKSINYATTGKNSIIGGFALQESNNSVDAWQHCIAFDNAFYGARITQDAFWKSTHVDQPQFAMFSDVTPFSRFMGFLNSYFINDSPHRYRHYVQSDHHKTQKGAQLHQVR